MSISNYENIHQCFIGRLHQCSVEEELNPFCCNCRKRGTNGIEKNIWKSIKNMVEIVTRNPIRPGLIILNSLHYYGLWVFRYWRYPSGWYQKNKLESITRITQFMHHCYVFQEIQPKCLQQCWEKYAWTMKNCISYLMMILNMFWTLLLMMKFVSKILWNFCVVKLILDIFGAQKPKTQENLMIRFKFNGYW